MVVEPALFWCAGTWKLSVDNSKRLRGVQRQMLVRMTCPKRKLGELDDQFFPRMESIVTEGLEKHGVSTWDARAREYYFKWAGTVARLGSDPDRIAPRMLHFYNIASVKEYARKHKGDQGHGRRLHVWRWESELVDYNPDWENLSCNALEWLSVHLEPFIFNTVLSNNLRRRGQKRASAALY
jgi:hypothetical protein